MVPLFVRRLKDMPTKCLYKSVFCLFALLLDKVNVSNQDKQLCKVHIISSPTRPTNHYVIK